MCDHSLIFEFGKSPFLSLYPTVWISYFLRLDWHLYAICGKGFVTSDPRKGGNVLQAKLKKSCLVGYAKYRF